MDEIHRTSGIAEGAIALIKALKLPATPRVYELCYAYSTGEYPTVNVAINDLLSRRTTVGDATIEQIAARYISPGGQQDQLHSVGTRVAQEIERVLGSLNTMAFTIDGCSGDIAAASQSAAASPRRETAITGLAQLMQSSGKITGEQRRLEAMLNESNVEIGNLREQLRKIRDTAGSDPLTGLPNRRQYKPLLAKALSESTKRGTPLCVAVSDINGFSAFNEAWGYDRGDQVLQLVAAEMKQKAGRSGLVMRSGGAQFTLVLHGISVGEAGVIADNVCRSVMQREVKIRSTGQKLGRVGLSFGIAGARPGDTEDTISARAEVCLRTAKRLGGNRVICEDDPVVGGSLDAAVA